jgi:hypothetical protein
VAADHKLIKFVFYMVLPNYLDFTTSQSLSLYRVRYLEVVMKLIKQKSVLAVILSDFGRDAGIRFAQTLAFEERRRVLEILGQNVPFFDEYRRITMVLTGDLPFVKERALSKVEDGLLNETLLVGFEGGVPLEEVIPSLGMLALEAIVGPVLRGMNDIIVLLPCNTLAPASHALEEAFVSAREVSLLLQSGGLEIPSWFDLLAGCWGSLRFQFPTVPEAVLKWAGDSGYDAILPLGTLGISEKYAAEGDRHMSKVRVQFPSAHQQEVVLYAIEAAIDGTRSKRELSTVELTEVKKQLADDTGGGVCLIEACTDLDYGIGKDSNTIYALHAVSQVYS